MPLGRGGVSDKSFNPNLDSLAPRSELEGGNQSCACEALMSPEKPKERCNDGRVFKIQPEMSGKAKSSRAGALAFQGQVLCADLTRGRQTASPRGEATWRNGKGVSKLKPW
jgi:hypothetical protein